MSKRLFISALALLAFGLAASFGAQQNPGATQAPPASGQEQSRRGMGGPRPVMGTITSVGVDRFEIKREDGTTQTVMVNDQTHYRQRQPGQQQPQELALEDLKVGDHVAVRGTPSGATLTAEAVNRITAEQFQRFQNGGGQGGPGGGGGWGQGGGGGMGPGGGGPRMGGEITAIKGNQITVESRRNGEHVIVVNDQTTFEKEGKTATLKDLKVGDRIFATGQESNGQFVATAVRSGRMGGGRGGWQGGQGGPPQN